MTYHEHNDRSPLLRFKLRRTTDHKRSRRNRARAIAIKTARRIKRGRA